MSTLTGKPAPAFTLPGSDGRDHTLADYAGKTVILYFYPKDNTPGCTKEACAFRDLQPDLAAMNAVVLGVSKDSRAAHDKFIADFGLPFVLLTDAATTMMSAYGAWGEKVMCGKKSLGIIRSTVIIGPDGTVRRHWPSVKKAEEHPLEVVAWLRANG